MSRKSFDELHDLRIVRTKKLVLFIYKTNLIFENPSTFCTCLEKMAFEISSARACIIINCETYSFSRLMMKSKEPIPIGMFEKNVRIYVYNEYFFHLASLVNQLMRICETVL